MTTATDATLALFKNAYQSRESAVGPSKTLLVPRPTPTPTLPQMTLSEAVGRAIRVIRKQQGLTLRQVSKKALVSLSHVSDTERGKKECSGFMLSCIIEGLDTDLPTVLRLASDLLEGKSND